MSRKKTAFLIIGIVIVLVFFVSLFASMGRSAGDRIGIVDIEGVISESKEIMDDIVRFKDDEAIRGVVVRINSPGGAVGPTQEIYREVIKLKEKKKVFVSMGSVCASGGYYIASAGEKVFANPSTVTGSIGVIMQLMVVEDVLKKLGLKSTTLKAGEYKDAGSPFREMTKEERAYLDGVMRDIHDQFIRDIAAGRKMELAAARKVADGRIFTGTQAKELGLVDTLGNFYDAVDEIKTALEIKGKPLLVHGERKFSLTKWLFSSIIREMMDEIISSRLKFLFM